MSEYPSCPQCGSVKSWNFSKGDYNPPGSRFDKANPDTGYCHKCKFSYSEDVRLPSMEGQVKLFREKRRAILAALKRKNK